MGVELNSAGRILKAGQLLAAAALVLRIGGFAPEVLPSGSASLGLLVLLLVYERLLANVGGRSRDVVVADARAWINKHWFWLGLGSVTIVGALLRFAGITQDLGHVALGIDENRLNQSVLYLFRTGDINYRTVEHYPGIHYWLLVGGYLLAYVWGLMKDVATTLAGMPREHFVAAGRTLSAVQSTATVLMTGLLGRRLAGPRTGLLAAALLAVAPLSISLGRQLRNDAAQTLIIVCAVYMALGTYRRAHRGWEPALGGTLAGLAAGVKYTGVFVLFPVLLAAVTCEDRQRRARATGLAAVGFLFAALISNHFVWADLPNLVDQLSDQILITGEGHWAAQDNPAAYHARILAQRVVGWPLLLLAAATTAYQLAAGRWRWWLFLVYPLTYVWFVAQRPSQLPRWVYPAAPFAAVAACAGLVALVELLEARLAHRSPGARWRRALAPAVVLAFFAPILLATITNLSRQLSTPTYTLAEQWLEENTDPGEGVLVENRWLQLDPRRHRLRRVGSLEDVLDGGRYELAANDWVVVHESLLGHRALERLRLAEAITVEPSLRGNQGPDFAVFAVPAVDPMSNPLDISFDEPGARDYLGYEWAGGPTQRGGRLLPADGARIFLPPLGGRSRRLEVTFVAESSAAAAGIEVFANGQRLQQVVSDPAVGSAESRDAPSTERSVTIELSIANVGPRVVEIFLRPLAESGAVNVLGFRLE